MLAIEHEQPTSASILRETSHHFSHGGEVMGLYDITIQDVIRQNAVFRRDKVALVCGDLRMTFGEYAREVDLLAAGLFSLGVSKGERIGVVAFNCHEFFLLYGAAARLGAIMLPVNWRLKPDEIQGILEDCTPSVVVASGEYWEAVSEISDRCPFVKHRLAMGEGGKGFRPLKEVASSGKELLQVDLSQKDPYLIVHTAAVEGRPRGAVLSHGNIVAANIQSMGVMGLDERSVHLNLLPLFHIAGFGMAMNVMQAGGRNVIMRKFDAKEAVDWIQREGVTAIGTFPPMLSMILDAAESEGKSLKSLCSVGGLDHPETMQRCQRESGARFWIGFGQTETSGFCTICPLDEKPGSAGKEGPLVRVRLVDDYDREVPMGQPGEIVVRGPLVFQGYWNLEKETAYTFREGWHHTGDIGRMDEQGYLWYVKRKAEKELIKPGGENVYPAEVEKALLEHPEVAEACVFGVPDKQWGEAIKAVCALTAESVLTPEGLIEFVASRIARYKKPKFVAFVESLPKSSDGAVDREKVKAEHGR
jgi:acyl-CoA synthetase (AMP-forming)/AMP-acid ligase II